MVHRNIHKVQKQTEKGKKKNRKIKKEEGIALIRNCPKTERG